MATANGDVVATAMSCCERISAPFDLVRIVDVVLDSMEWMARQGRSRKGRRCWRKETADSLLALPPHPPSIPPGTTASVYAHSMEKRPRGATRPRTQSPVPGPARDVTPPSARRASGSRGSGMVALAASIKGKEVIRNPLAGFDDREEDVDPREELEMLPIEDVDEEEHCAICLSPIADRVSTSSEGTPA